MMDGQPTPVTSLVCSDGWDAFCVLILSWEVTGHEFRRVKVQITELYCVFRSEQ